MTISDSHTVAPLRLWISYPYVNREEWDFSYLVPQLKKANIEASYEPVPLVSERRLWERVVPRLVSIGFDGWLYILTHQCFTRRAFTEELSETIQRTTARLGPKFPMIGLIHGIATHNIPLVLRIRPCVSLGDLQWKQQLATVLYQCDWPGKARTMPTEKKFSWRVHPCYGGDASMTAIEVWPAAGRLQYWRFAVPKSARVVHWGQGPANGGGISPSRFAEARGSGRFERNDILWFGAANTISDTESAYIVFLGSTPDFVCFGPAKSPFGPPDSMEMIQPSQLNRESLVKP